VEKERERERDSGKISSKERNSERVHVKKKTSFYEKGMREISRRNGGREERGE